MDGPDAIATEGERASSSEHGMVEFEVSGDFGVRVVVKGPVSDRAELEDSVLRLIRQMKRSGDEADTPAG